MKLKLRKAGYYAVILIFLFNTPTQGLSCVKLLGAGKTYATPYYIIDSDISGPAVCIIGGTHGDEPAGCRTAQELLTLKPDCGKLIIIPMANLRAVKLGRREIPGEGDLNRCYPGSATGILMEELAFEMFELMKEQKISVLVDLHESLDYHLINNQYLGQTVIAYGNEMSIWAGGIAIEKVNAGIAIPAEKFSLLKNPIKGSTAWAVGKYLQVPSFTVETCKKLKLSDRTDYMDQIIRCVLAEVGVRLPCKG
jgi:predicted deacylase